MRFSILLFTALFTLCCLPSDSPAADPAKPRVLLLGDSISIGYTPFVVDALKEEATVLRPARGANPKTKKPRHENCAGTTNGVKQIDRWLAYDGGKWDIVHFNFGLHDLKRVKADTGKNSNDPNDPRQADLETYEKQLREIVGKLKKTGASLIFATTTPYPPGCTPHRDPEDAQRYNEIALKIMKEHDIAINDLYSFALPKLKEIQRPVNVHFTPEGSNALSGEVVKHLRQAMKAKR